MSRLAPLYKVESFRSSVLSVFKLSSDELLALREAGVGELAVGVASNPLRTQTELSRRAFGLLYEAAVRDGIDEVEQELREAFPDVAEEEMGRVVRAITPDSDDKERFGGIDERDGFLPILVDHRLALDLRVTDADGGRPIATPFVTARFEFDSLVAPGIGAVVFQLNLADIDGLATALTAVRERAQKLIANSNNMSIPEWGHGLTV